MPQMVSESYLSSAWVWSDSISWMCSVVVSGRQRPSTSPPFAMVLSGASAATASATPTMAPGTSSRTSPTSTPMDATVVARVRATVGTENSSTMSLSSMRSSSSTPTLSLLRPWTSTLSPATSTVVRPSTARRIVRATLSMPWDMLLSRRDQSLMRGLSLMKICLMGMVCKVFRWSS
jgi:hypothetical protein